ncbi:hypothetical protein Glove_109g335 [Diversispora epigaea]|uniref:Uncharacterized protein n=1 Tax=Diversispora epigaea TaxID=1348612 RepID=A0A397J2U9_9GLOM|nr:hypothetical protein Glove_109g335 [Diversispora epigaea]
MYACSRLGPSIFIFNNCQKTKTITRTRNYTKTVYPTNCPARETTIIATSTTTNFINTTSTTTSTTITPSPSKPSPTTATRDPITL